MKTSISIIIPCYNEENNLKRGVLDQIQKYLSTSKLTAEVIVANDRSTDNSLRLVREFCRHHHQFRVLDLPKSGKAGAIWRGIEQAKYPLVLFTDMDQSTPIKEIEKLLPFFNQGYDIVIGSRGTSRSGVNSLRKIGSAVFSATRNFLLHTSIADTQCGFKAMKTNLAKKIFPRLAVIKNFQNGPGWRVTAYDVELLFITQRSGYRIKEVPVIWNNEDTSVTKGDATSRYFRESKQMAAEVWRIFINNLKGQYVCH